MFNVALYTCSHAPLVSASGAILDYIQMAASTKAARVAYLIIKFHIPVSNLGTSFHCSCHFRSLTICPQRRSSHNLSQLVVAKIKTYNFKHLTIYHKPVTLSTPSVILSTISSNAILYTATFVSKYSLFFLSLSKRLTTLSTISISGITFHNPKHLTILSTLLLISQYFPQSQSSHKILFTISMVSQNFTQPVSFHNIFNNLNHLTILSIISIVWQYFS